jgi:hypothetical protein
MTTRESQRLMMNRKKSTNQIGYNSLDKSKRIGYNLRDGTIESADSDAWGCSNKEKNAFSCSLPIFSFLFSPSYIGYSYSHLRLSRHNEPDGSSARGATGVVR